MATIDEMRREAALPVVIANHLGLITYVNAPFRETFGWEEGEILGRPLTTIIPKSMHHSHHLGFSRFVMTGKPTLLDKRLRLMAVTKGGEEFDSEHFIIAEKKDGQWIFGATIRPLKP